MKETIFVGLSGGVDSSVAALRLKNSGYAVVGVFIKVWQPDFLPCNWEQERLDAMRVAAHLDIPFLTCDAEETYKKDVADYMIREYSNGRTPNPDVMCNRFVKFGAFLDFARSYGVNKVATGHYAQIEGTPHGHSLIRGIDPKKDQSYFLWTLTQTQLTSILMPVGGSTKETIRAEAEAAGLPTAHKHDSQGICFLGEVNLESFLREYVTLREGAVLGPDGNQIGVHHGALLYTLGQRHGFTIHTPDSSRRPYYVTDKDISKNTITVSTDRPLTTAGTITLTDVNHIQPWNTEGTAQFRYHGPCYRVSITEDTNGCAMLTLLEAIETPSRGQSCVLYNGAVCVGGGIIA